MKNEKVNPTEQDVQNLVVEIREWLEKELPETRRDDRRILCFLEGCKYRIETAKTKLKNDYHFRRNTPEWFADRDPETKDIKDALACGISFLPENFRDEKGRRIHFVRPNIHDPSYSGDIYYKILNMCTDVEMEYDHLIAKNGLITIIDLDKSTFTHCMKKMMVMKKLIHWFMGCYPLQIKEMHVINAPSIAIYFLDLAKNLLKKKIRKRFIIHKKPDELKHYVDPKFLPNEYGGRGGSIDEIVQNYTKKLLDKREFLMNGIY